MRLSLCQMNVTGEKEENLQKAKSLIEKSAKEGADIIALPEMWSCPYSNKYFREFSEPESGKTVEFLGNLAIENNVYIVGGSIPEIEDNRVYNTSFIFDRNGKVIKKHRKIHLFDIDVEGGITFKESDTLTRGNDITVFDTEFCKVGVAICYDVRFPELFRLMTLSGAELVILPGAFNMTTGPSHWELTMRARALDNQIYFAAVSPARDEKGPYQAFGHSCIIDPWGNVVEMTDEKESTVTADIDFEKLRKIRKELPLLAHRRTDIYEVKEI